MSHFPEKAWIDPETGKAPRMTLYKGKPEICGYWLERSIKPGERYFIKYSHIKGSHIVTASRDDNGDIRVYDPQCNKKYIGIDSINARFGKKSYKVNGMMLMRVDNLDLNLSYANAVLKR